MATEDSRFSDNHKEYNDAFRVLSRSRSEQQKVWVENDVVPKLRDIFTHANPTPKSEFKVLAVGSNEGSFDILLLKALFSHAKELVEGKQVVYTVVELNAAAIDEFKNNVALEDASFRNIKFYWVNKRIEDFLDTKEPERYDLIHLINVLYYVEHEEKVLKNAHEKFLKIPGCILTAVAAEENIWVNLIKSFKSKIPSLIVKNQLTNVKLSEVCKRNGWAHEIFDVKVDLEVTKIFKENDPVGQAMLKFFLYINEEPKEKLGEKLMSELMQFFRRMSWEKMKDGRKCLFVKEDNGILLTYKRC